MLDLQKLYENLNKSMTSGLRLLEEGEGLSSDRDRIVQLIQILKDEYKYIMLADITAADYIDYFEVVYHIMNIKAETLKIKVRLEKEDAVIPSLTPVWKAADVQEREIFDLMGVTFIGHGNLKRILCKDDFNGHPLRKDFKLDIVNRF